MKHAHPRSRYRTRHIGLWAAVAVALGAIACGLGAPDLGTIADELQQGKDSESSSAATKADLPTTYLVPTTPVGTLPGAAASIGRMGSAEYSFPILVSAGRAGLQPQLALAYNHFAGNSVAGLGFRLTGVPAISECPENYRDHDRLTPPGNGKPAVTGGGGVAGSPTYCMGTGLLYPVADGAVTNEDGHDEFQLRPFDGSRITHPTDEVFEQWLPDGRIRRFVQADVDPVTEQRPPLWLLDQETDLSGNRIVYEHGGECGDVPCLERVLYNFDGDTPLSIVNLIYAKGRPDPMLGYWRRQFASVHTHLERIEVRWEGDNPGLVHRYRFTYVDEIVGEGSEWLNGRSRLARVAFCAPGAWSSGTLGKSEVCIPATQFLYNEWDPDYQVVSEPELPGPSLGQEGSVVATDINRDGKDDLLYVTDVGGEDAWVRVLSNPAEPDGFAAPQALGVTVDHPVRSVQVLDVTFDGVNDVAYLDGEGEVVALVGRGDGTFEHRVLRNAESMGERVALLLGLDIDGDGLPELMSCEGLVPEDGTPPEQAPNLQWVRYRAASAGPLGTVFIRSATGVHCRPFDKVIVDSDNDGAPEIVDIGQPFDCDQWAMQENDHDNGQGCRHCPIWPLTDTAYECILIQNGCAIGEAGDDIPCELSEYTINEPGVCESAFALGVDNPDDVEYYELGCGIDASGHSGLELTSAGVRGGPLRTRASKSFDRTQFPDVAGVGDFNGDGSQDIAFRNGHELRLAISNDYFGGYTNFDIEIPEPLGEVERFLDYDRDGDTDLLMEIDDEWHFVTFSFAVDPPGAAGADPDNEEPILSVSYEVHPTGIEARGPIVMGNFSGIGIELLENSSQPYSMDDGGIGLTWSDRWRVIAPPGATVPGRATKPAVGGGLLAEVIDGYGKHTHFGYQILEPEQETCEYPVACDTPRGVLARSLRDDGGGEVRYEFFGFRDDMLGQRSLGPERIRVTQLRGADDPWVTEYRYDNRTFDDELNAFPFAGIAVEVTHWQGVGATTATHTYTRQRVTPATVAGTALDAAGFARNYIAYAHDIQARSYELGAPVDELADLDDLTSYTGTRERRWIDAFGFTTDRVVETLPASGDMAVETRQPSHDTDRWLLSRPVAIEVASTTPSSAKTRSVAFGYGSDGQLDWIESEPKDAAFMMRVDYSYDTYGNVDAVTSTSKGTTRKTTAAYDACAGIWQSSATNAMGHESTADYDCRLGLVRHTWDPQQVGYAFTYDAFGRTVASRLEDAKGGAGGEFATTTFSRLDGGAADQPSRMRIASLAAGHSDTWIDLDVFGRAVVQRASIDGKSSVRRTFYDTLGRVYRIEQPHWATESSPGDALIAYDNHDRLVGVDGPGIFSMDYAYPEPRLVAVTDGEGRTMHVELDEQMRPERVLRGVGTGSESTICRDYGPFRTLESVRLGCGTSDEATVRTIEWDEHGYQPLLIADDGVPRSVVYGAFGQPDSATDGNGRTVRFKYNALGQLTSQWNLDTVETRSFGYVTPTNSASFGPVGALKDATLTDAYGKVVRKDIVRDQFGYVTKTQTTLGGQVQTEKFAYDDFRRIETRSISTLGNVMPGLTLGYGYATYGSRPRAVYDVDTGAVFGTVEELDAAGRWLADSRGNGVRTERAYDLRGNPNSQLTTRPAVDALDYISGDYILNHDLQGWDASGNLDVTVHLKQRMIEDLSYDALNRLTHVGVYDVEGTLFKETATSYDAFGNFEVHHGVGYDATPGGRLLSTDLEAFTYDDNGNLLGITPVAGEIGGVVDPGSAAAGAEAVTLEWNAWDRPVRVSTDEHDVEFAYDPFGTRLRRIEGDVTRVFLGDYQRVTNGHLPATHEFTVRLDGEVVAQVTRTGKLGGLETRGGESEPLFDERIDYITNDIRSTPNVITDGKAKVVKRVRYGAWGDEDPPEWFADYDAAYDEPSPVNVGYTGHPGSAIADRFTDMGGRFFDRKTAHFVSADPMTQFPWSPQGYNRYAYAANNPRTFTDKSGFCVDNYSGGSCGGGNPWNEPPPNTGGGPPSVPQDTPYPPGTPGTEPLGDGDCPDYGQRCGAIQVDEDEPPPPSGGGGGSTRGPGQRSQRRESTEMPLASDPMEMSAGGFLRGGTMSGTRELANRSYANALTSNGQGDIELTLGAPYSPWRLRRAILAQEAVTANVLQGMESINRSPAMIAYAREDIFKSALELSSRMADELRGRLDAADVINESEPSLYWGDMYVEGPQLKKEKPLGPFVFGSDMTTKVQHNGSVRLARAYVAVQFFGVRLFTVGYEFEPNIYQGRQQLILRRALEGGHAAPGGDWFQLK